MGVKRDVLDFATATLKTAIRVASVGQSSRVFSHLAEQFVPVVEENAGIGSLKFFCPSPMPEWRARTLMTKEPETIEWIGTFDKSDVLWDIGANVGVYTLYAALRGLSVLAFEPSPGNYYVLSRNIEINGFSERVSSYCIAFNNETLLDSFYMSNTELGGALSSFGEAIDWKGEIYTAKFKQSMLGFSIDDFIRQFNPPFPTHLKIDVDGIEKKIVQGATATLTDKRLKTVLIELNVDLDDCGETIAIMEQHGFGLHKREHSNQFCVGTAKSVYNHIFARKE